MIMTNRKPAVAGTFYPATATALNLQLSMLFENVMRVPDPEVAALIVPHAGYVFSGSVAASAYAKLNRQKQYKNIFIIGRSHRKYFEGVSVFPHGNYITPSGLVEINEETASQLIEGNKFIYYNEEADSTEHSLEVQLPFLQYWLNNEFRIVPMIIGSDDPSISTQLAEALRPWFNADNLFVISTDFSHYPTYDMACKTDTETANAIVANDAQLLKKCCDKGNAFLSGNLQTALCGAAAVQTLLHLTRDNKEISLEKIVYKNSGDVPQGDKDRVVGYWAISASRKNDTLVITEQDKNQMFRLVKESIKEAIGKSNSILPGLEYTGILNQHLGVFVTLRNNGKLRGCIGRFNPKQPLYQTLKDVAISSATKDYRFDAVTKEELDEIDIEISILTPLKKIRSVDQIQLGKHGIYIKNGLNSGTFLPQVALEMRWTKDEFLGHCARDKAGIEWDGWKTAELFTYEAIVIRQK